MVWEGRGHWVYRAWDGAGRPLYVGCTGDLKKRRAGHAATSEWYPYAVRFETVGPFTKEAALLREKDEIRGLRPLFNALPEHALMGRRRSRRLQELHREMEEAAGLSAKEIVQSGGDLNALKPIWAAAERLVDQEFDLRCTHQGRVRHYQELVAEEVA